MGIYHGRLREAVAGLKAVLALLVLPVMSAMILGTPEPSSAAPARGSGAPQIILDGRRVAADPPPMIVQGRTLIPLRAVFEAMGAEVSWNPDTRAVTVRRGERWVQLWVDGRTACLAAGCRQATLLDVPARIAAGRTFVPLRFVAEAMGAAVSWRADTQTVIIDSQGGTGIALQPAVRIVSPAPGQPITGSTSLRLEPGTVSGERIAAVRYYLLDPQTGRGPLIARGHRLDEVLTWTPDPRYDGERLLVVAVYDGQGQFLGGDARAVTQRVEPAVALGGVTPGQRVEGALRLRPELNFVATRVRYELGDPATGSASVLAETADPYGEFVWTPTLPQNGARTLRVIAYDRLGRSHASQPVPIVVNVARQLRLTGVEAGAVLNRPVTLGVAANFPVRKTRYRLHDPARGTQAVLAERDGQESFRWFPGPERAGTYELDAVVEDAQGQTFTTERVRVELPGQPRLLLTTVGPRQVLAGTVELGAVANVPLRSIEFQLVHPSRGPVRRLAGGNDATRTYRWEPSAGDAGNWSLRAVAVSTDGRRLESEAVPVRVHTGPLYGPRPVVAKDRFLDFAAGFAVTSLERTGMSAALQVAQAILETGWGQSTPVDKYTGKPSYNLFGIKGTGPAGSVTSNTWEEYNGVVYRIDAAFRAYRDPAQSWEDHKRLLLQAERYAPFRAVMHDPIMGAWALRRAGYATDSRYPQKLIDLMDRYDLYRLDEMAP